MTSLARARLASLETITIMVHVLLTVRVHPVPEAEVVPVLKFSNLIMTLLRTLLPKKIMPLRNFGIPYQKLREEEQRKNQRENGFQRKY